MRTLLCAAAVLGLTGSVSAADRHTVTVVSSADGLGAGRLMVTYKLTAGTRGARDPETRLLYNPADFGLTADVLAATLPYGHLCAGAVAPRSGAVAVVHRGYPGKADYANDSVDGRGNLTHIRWSAFAVIVRDDAGTWGFDAKGKLRLVVVSVDTRIPEPETDAQVDAAHKAVCDKVVADLWLTGTTTNRVFGKDKAP